MSALIPFSQIDSAVPAHLAELFGDAGNIATRISIDQLSSRGKVWRRVVDGEETALTRKNAEGDIEPVPLVNLIVLDQNRSRSRAFYVGNFEEGKNAAPACYSGDGVTPDAGVKEPVSKTCATCPNAVKGSKITESGKQSTLCSPFKRLAVVPSQGVAKHPVMLLRLAQTSVWDKNNAENESKGWYAWDQYVDMLRARGAKHTAAVETKVKFDMSKAYPKLLFSASRWLSPEEAAAAKARIADDADDIAQILTGAGADDGVAGHPAVDVGHEEEMPAPVVAKPAAPKPAAPKPAAPKPVPAPVVVDDEGDGSWDAPAEDAPAPVAPKAKPAAPKAKPVPPPAAEVVSGTPSGLKDLLDGWDD